MLNYKGSVGDQGQPVKIILNLWCIIAYDSEKDKTVQVTGCYENPGEAWKAFNFTWPPKEGKIWDNPRKILHRRLQKVPGSSEVFAIDNN